MQLPVIDKYYGYGLLRGEQHKAGLTVCVYGLQFAIQEP